MIKGHEKSCFQIHLVYSRRRVGGREATGIVGGSKG